MLWYYLADRTTVFPQGIKVHILPPLLCLPVICSSLLPGRLQADSDCKWFAELQPRRAGLPVPGVDHGGTGHLPQQGQGPPAAQPQADGGVEGVDAGDRPCFHLTCPKAATFNTHMGAEKPAIRQFSIQAILLRSTAEVSPYQKYGEAADRGIASRFCSCCTTTTRRGRSTMQSGSSSLGMCG